jgi:hypothetical protein
VLNNFERDFMADIGELPLEDSKIRGKPADLVFRQLLETTKYDEQWVGIGLPESFRQVYDSLTGIQETPPPSVEWWGTWELNAKILKRRLQDLVNEGWNKENFSDQESLFATGDEA